MKSLVIFIAASSIVLAACTTTDHKSATVKPNDKPVATATVEDPYLWLEETDSAKALDWVKARNAESVKTYGSRKRATRSSK